MDSLVTILGSSYFEPIAELFAKIESSGVRRERLAQVGMRENGYSVSVCILAVACLESYVMRARYLNSPEDLGGGRTPVSKYLAHLYPDFPYVVESEELYILRDSLIHNHLWEMGYSWDDDPGLVQDSVEKKSPGDK